MKNATTHALRVILSVLVLDLCASTASSADLGSAEQRPLAEPSAADRWSFSFTTYGWVPWLSGNTVVKGHAFDVSVNPSELFSHLDWSTLPAWMSYAEARRGPISLFNDIVYVKLTGSTGFSRDVHSATFSGTVSSDYTQATVEVGGAYELWAGSNPLLAGSTEFDILSGARYWHQDVNITGVLSSPPFLRETERSGSVDWVDPFVGARLRNQLGPGQEMVMRADFGGFGAGSDFSWQVLATYNWKMCLLNGYVLDGYVGYRALSVDYSQGAGGTRYEFDVLQQGPVMGSTLHF